MKKVLLAAGLLVMLLSSCDKKYTCQCSSGLVATRSFTVTAKNSDDAETKCAESANSATGEICSLSD